LQKEHLMAISCAACDTLIEDVHFAMLRDVDALSKNQLDQSMIKQAGVVQLKFGANETIARMLADKGKPNPDPEHPWATYQASFRETCQLELEAQAVTIGNQWTGVPVKHARQHVYKVKERLCHSACDRLAIRFPAMPETSCGYCMETVRDISALWEREMEQDESVAWRILEGVCEDMDLRHKAAIVDDMRSTCEELLDEYQGKIKRMLLKVTGQWRARQEQEIPMAAVEGFLFRTLCIDTANSCSFEQVRSSLQRFPPSVLALMSLGGEVGLPKDYKKKKEETLKAQAKKEL